MADDAEEDWAAGADVEADWEAAGAQRRGRRRGRRRACAGDAGGDADAGGDDADAFVDLSAACELTPDHAHRPLYALPTLHILLEATHPLRKAAYDFLVFVAEPVRRPAFLHEYRLTRASVASAMALFGIEGDTIVDVLRKLSKVKLDATIASFIKSCERHAGRAKVVLDDIGYRVESPDKALLTRLLEDGEVAESRMRNDGAGGAVPADHPLLASDAPVDASAAVLRRRLESAAEAVERRRVAADAAASAAKAAMEGSAAASADVAKRAAELRREAARLEREATQVLDDEEDVAAAAPSAAASAANPVPPASSDATVYSFRVLPHRVETVRRRCLPTSPASLNCPLYQEYDYHQRSQNARTPPLHAGLKPLAVLRPYQQKCLHRMFYQSRARSGIVVLPCGAGKSLTGVAAAMKVNQATLVLCTSNESAEQWRLEFLHWTTLSEDQVLRYNAAGRREFGKARAGASEQPQQPVPPGGVATAAAGTAAAGMAPAGGEAAAAAVAAGKGLVIIATYHMIASAAKKAQAAHATAVPAADGGSGGPDTAPAPSAADVAAIPQHWRSRMQQPSAVPGVTPLDELVKATRWGLVVLDEVHVVPAHLFRTVLHHVTGHVKLGLTATLIREDDRIQDLMYLIGPKLYEADWVQLKNEGFLANVQCCEVRCDMAREFFGEYLLSGKDDAHAVDGMHAPMLRGLLASMNPIKFQTCQFLVQYHEQVTHDKVLIYGDSLFVLREYAKRLRRPLICGSTSHAERQRILHAFKNSPEVNTIILSRVGDTSIDLPEANVLIQISGHGGSRRQEAQRLGRILRPKRNVGAAPVNASGDGPAPAAETPGASADAELRMGKPVEFNAYFYTLVSRDTDEILDAQKRRRYLVDQGYEYKVVSNLVSLPAAQTANLDFQTAEQRMDLLYRTFQAVTVRPKAQRKSTQTGKAKKAAAAKGEDVIDLAAADASPAAPAPAPIGAVLDDDDDDEMEADVEAMREMEREMEEAEDEDEDEDEEEEEVLRMRPSKFARTGAVTAAAGPSRKTLDELTGAAGATYFEYDT